MNQKKSRRRIIKNDSLRMFPSTPTQKPNSSMSLGHIIDHSKPDINIQCDVCKSFMNVSELSIHMAYHDALLLYKFKDPPTTMETLIRRREMLIQRMNKLNISNDSYLKYVKTINDTFQILKRSIEPYMYGDNGFIYDNKEASQVQGFSFTPRNRLFLSVGMCSSQNKQFKVDMEDSMKFIDCFGGNERFAYLGVFDGYHGKTASNLCREHLHDAALYELAKLFPEMKSTDIEETLVNRIYARVIDPSNTAHEKVEEISEAFRLSFSKMDYLLSRGMYESSPTRWSGVSAFTALIVANNQIEQMVDHLTNEKESDNPLVFGQIHVANCGNVEALGIRAGEAFLMSQKHTLTNQREHSRVLETGVKISENNLVAGVLETTRGLGNHGDKDLKKSVITSPYCWTYEIDSNLECIIIATEGLWDVLRYDIVVDLVTQCLPAHHLSAPSRIHTALRSVLAKYGHQSKTPDSLGEDDTNQSVNDILSLIDDGNDLWEDANLTSDRAVQCNPEEIQQEIWNTLPAEERLRLELAQSIAERLVSAALLAQSKSNISVMCLLLPGAAI